MTLNEQEKVWKFSTLLPINDEYCLMIHINYFEEVVGFEVVLNLPDYLDNEIFKHKVNSMGEFTMLDKYTARVFMLSSKEIGTSFLVIDSSRKTTSLAWWM